MQPPVFLPRARMNHDANDFPEPADDADDDAPIQEARVWQGNGFTARVIKNEEDEGWAVAMIKDGEPEPALVGPWTMGRDKKKPQAARRERLQHAGQDRQRGAAP